MLDNLAEGPTFFKRTITDKTWGYECDDGTVQKSSEWRFKN